jgi:predicted Zn-dependent protease
MRVNGSPLAPAGTASTSTGGGAPLWWPGSVAPHPMSVLLFGKRKPRRVDKRKYPGLRKALRKLEGIKDQLAELAGFPAADIEIELCEGDNAFISHDAQISIGVGLLSEHEHDDDLLVAVLGHEIGHRPWSWKVPDVSTMTRAEIDQLRRDEEAKADRFAGRVLADLGADPESVCRFLLSAAKFETHPPSDYYPAADRARMIRDAFRRRDASLRNARSVLGELMPKTRELR